MSGRSDKMDSVNEYQITWGYTAVILYNSVQPTKKYGGHVNP
jgi:hypothetical protein